MLTTGVCPNQELLEQYLLGRVPADDRPSLENHLARCPACLVSLQTLRPADALLRTLQALGTAQTEQDSAIVLDLVRRVESLLPSSDGFSPPEVHRTLVVDMSAGLVAPHRPAGLAFLSPSLQADEIGRLSHYRVLKRLGSGGMGMVFLAEDLDLQRPVALKVMRPDAAEKQGAAQRFLREARVTAAIKNDHIVTIYQVGEDNGVPFLAMELLHGASLEDWLQHNPRPNLPQILRIGREIALGLAAAHERGLIHRDIKPANVWVETPNDRIKIVDFGLARQIEGGEVVTLKGTIVGTPAFMSPEQARGEAGVDSRCDLFSLGCVLYRLFSGRSPFQARSVLATLAAIKETQQPSAATLRADIPPELAGLIDQLLSKEVDARPANAGVVVEALAAIERSLLEPSTPPSVTDALATEEQKKSSPSFQIGSSVSNPPGGTDIRATPADGKQTGAPVPVETVDLHLGIPVVPSMPGIVSPALRHWPWIVAVILGLVVGAVVAWSVFRS